MQKTVCEFPEWINDFVVDDDLFARAYEAVPDQRRALLKTGIARLFEWYGPSRQTAKRTDISWRGGFDSVEDLSTVDFAVVVIDASLKSSARLLAAVVPALSCGVRNVAVVRLDGGEWPQPMLAGLELAGQELVVDMPSGRVKELLETLDASGATGIVLGVELEQGVLRSLRFPTRRIEFACLRCDRTVPVWMEQDQPFDLEGLAFIHPDLVFSVHGVETVLPADGFSREGSDSQGFLDSILEVAYAPASLVDEALDRARLVLGPGQEGCWVWPQLRPGHFQSHSTAWIIGA